MVRHSVRAFILSPTRSADMKTLLLVLALAATRLPEGALSWEFDCDRMDILNSNNVTPMRFDTFPYLVTCHIKDRTTIEVLVREDPSRPRPYTGIMVQVHKDGVPIGTFRTRSSSSRNPNAVGDQYEVTCDNKIAQASTDKTDKRITEGRWYNAGDLDLNTGGIPTCLISVVERDEFSRWVKVPFTATGRSGAPPVSPPRTPPATRRPPPPLPPPTTTTTTTTTTTPKPTTQPTTTTTERDHNAGDIQVDDLNFRQHCVADSYARVPLPHTGCNRYLSARRDLARAVHTCPGALCFDTMSCKCRACGNTRCPRTPNPSNLNIDIYDISNVRSGAISRTREPQPGLTAGFQINQNTEGLTNPNFIPDRPIYVSPGAKSTGNTGVRQRPSNNRSGRPIGSFGGIGDIVRNALGFFR